MTLVYRAKVTNERSQIKCQCCVPFLSFFSLFPEVRACFRGDDFATCTCRTSPSRTVCREGRGLAVFYVTKNVNGFLSHDWPHTRRIKPVSQDSASIFKLTRRFSRKTWTRRSPGMRRLNSRIQSALA